MMSLKCMDMGKDCNFVARGNTKEDVKASMMEHVKMAHPELLKVPDDEKKMMDKKMDELTKEM